MCSNIKASFRPQCQSGSPRISPSLVLRPRSSPPPARPLSKPPNRWSIALQAHVRPWVMSLATSPARAFFAQTTLGVPAQPPVPHTLTLGIVPTQLHWWLHMYTPQTQPSGPLDPLDPEYEMR